MNQEQQTSVENALTANRKKSSSKNRVLALVSGGIDSTVLLAKLSNEGKQVMAIMFDYGQENLEPTFQNAQYQCNKYGVELKLIKIPFDWSKASIIRGNYVDEEMSEENIYKKDVKALSWVPARNATMLLVAGGIASENNIKEVYCSFQFDKVEWETYEKLKLKYKFGAPDLTPRFLLYLNKTAKFCYKTNVKFIAPFIDKKLDCYEIVQLGRELNVDFTNTYSCRYYVEGKVCGVCEQCIIRDRRLS